MIQVSLTDYRSRSIQEVINKVSLALTAPSSVVFFLFFVPCRYTCCSRLQPCLAQPLRHLLHRRITSLCLQGVCVACAGGRNSPCDYTGYCPPPLLRAQVVWRICLASTHRRANLLSGTQVIVTATVYSLRRSPRSAYADYRVCFTTGYGNSTV